jgi:hypothetical protein
MTCADALRALQHRQDPPLPFRRGIAMLTSYWSRRRALDQVEQMNFAEVAGSAPCSAFMDAIKELAQEGSQYPPSPADVARKLRGNDPGARTSFIGVSVRRRDLSSSAMTAVRRAHAAGEEPCRCHPRPTTYRMDSVGVIRCPLCRHIEHGQWDTATEEGGP